MNENRFKNARKRFRQGRLSYEKFKAISNEEFLKLQKKIVDKVAARQEQEAHEHTHGPDCNHAEDSK